MFLFKYDKATKERQYSIQQINLDGKTATAPKQIQTINEEEMKRLSENIAVSNEKKIE